MQDDTEGCQIIENYLGVSDEQAIEHFVSELRQSFLPAAIPEFREQLIEMVSLASEGGCSRRQDPSVQGRLTVTRALVYTPETLPPVEEVDDEEEPDQKLYSVRVSEMRDYTRTYTVLATSEAEATEKAEKGETESETDGTLTEISGREAISTPQLIQ